MLIRALEIQIRRDAHLRPQRTDTLEGHPRVRPHVHDVGDLLVVLRLLAEELGRVQIEPGIDALALDPLGHRFDQLGGARMHLAGLAVNEERDRHAPGPLA